jgi:hypothetical protein
MFAAKLYLVQPPRQYTADATAKELQTSINPMEEVAKKEMGLWKELAPPLHSAYCKDLTLNGVPTLTMPFFPPITIAQRRSAWPLIKERLEEFAKIGYAYNEVRWRHVGYREIEGKMQITMIDLGSLDKVDAMDTMAANVQNQVDDMS